MSKQVTTVTKTTNGRGQSSIVARRPVVRVRTTKVQPQQRPVGRRRLRGRANNGRGLFGPNSILRDPFIRCALSRPGDPSMSATIPDGDPSPCFVFEHTQTYVVNCNNSGQLAFALIASPAGGIGMGQGIWQNITTNTIGGGGVVSGIAISNISSTAASVSAGIYPLIPWKEAIAANGENIQTHKGTLLAQKFKVVGCSAKVMYTGDDFHNSGVVCVARLNMDIDDTVPADPAGSVGYIESVGVLLQRAPLTFTECSQIPGSEVYPVTRALHLNNPPFATQGKSIKVGWCPTTFSNTAFATAGIWPLNGSQPFAALATDNATTYAGCYGMGSNQVTFYQAQGMSTSTNQSVTIQVKTCIQYNPSQASPMLQMSCPPDPARPNALPALQHIARTMPPAITEGDSWLKGAGDMLMGAAKAAAPIIGGIFGGPIGTIAGGVASSAMGSAMDSMRAMSIGQYRQPPLSLL